MIRGRGTDKAIRLKNQRAQGWQEMEMAIATPNKLSSHWHERLTIKQFEPTKVSGDEKSVQAVTGCQARDINRMIVNFQVNG